jgi:hypothetical protein
MLYDWMRAGGLVDAERRPGRVADVDRNVGRAVARRRGTDRDDVLRSGAEGKCEETEKRQGPGNGH